MPSPRAGARDQGTRGKKTELMEGEGVTKPMMTWALIWVAPCGKLWVLLKKTLLRQQGDPQQGVLSYPPLLAQLAGL